MELIACEVYANEASSARDDSSESTSKSDQQTLGRKSNQSAVGGSRASRVLQPDYLPTVRIRARVDLVCVLKLQMSTRL